MWAPAWKRLESKIAAQQYALNEIQRRQESRGDPPIDLTKRTKKMEPIAIVTSEGNIEWNRDITKMLDTEAGIERKD